MPHTKAVRISSRSDLGITTDEPQGCGVVMVQSTTPPLTSPNTVQGKLEDAARTENVIAIIVWRQLQPASTRDLAVRNQSAK